MIMQLFLIISNLKGKKFALEERKALTPRSSSGIIIPRSTFYPCWPRTLPHKGLEDNTYNLPDSLNQLDWTSLSKCQEEISFLEELIAYRKSQPLLRLKKGQEIRDYCDVKWLSDHHFIYTIEKIVKNNDSCQYR